MSGGEYLNRLSRSIIAPYKGSRRRQIDLDKKRPKPVEEIKYKRITSTFIDLWDCHYPLPRLYFIARLLSATLIYDNFSCGNIED